MMLNSNKPPKAHNESIIENYFLIPYFYEDETSAYQNLSP